jgi:hypothetical protein
MMMAKKAKVDRQDPRSNKSLAIREIVAKMPKAKASEIVEAVKSEYGHTVTPTLVYLVKSKTNVKKAARKTGAAPAPTMGSAAEWVESIKLTRRLLQASGSVENAVAILKAVEG